MNNENINKYNTGSYQRFKNLIWSDISLRLKRSGSSGGIS